MNSLIPTAHASFTSGIAEAITFGRSVGLSNLSFVDLIGNIGTFLIGLVAALALVAIVWGGIMYIVSLGNEQRSARAKSIIVFAIGGLLIAGTAQLIYALVVCIYTKPCSLSLRISDFVTIIFRLVNVLLAPAGAIAFGALIYGGYLYLISGGDESRASRAKHTIVYALLGLAVIGIAGIIVNVVIGLL